MRIGFALGGGGALSLSFLPIIETLEKEGITPSVGAGVSMGAIIGVLYALHKNMEKTKSIIKEYLDSEPVNTLKEFSSISEPQEKMFLVEKAFKFVKDLYLWNIRVIKKMLVNPQPFMDLFNKIFGNYSLEDLKIPFKVISTDLYTHQPFIIEKGSVSQALMSTISVPGFFPPYKFGDRLLVDGGVVRPCPTKEIRKDCDFLIAFVSKTRLENFKSFNNLLEVMFYSDLIRDRLLLEELLKYADFVFRLDFDNLCWVDFEKKDSIIKAGQNLVESEIKELKVKINKFKWRRFFFFH